MTEYTRQMHEKIMKIYRRETIRQYLWASIGFFPPVGALLLMIPLKDKVLSLFSTDPETLQYWQRFSPQSQRSL